MKLFTIFALALGVVFAAEEFATEELATEELDDYKYEIVNPFTSCGSQSDTFAVDSIDVNPIPAKVGKDLTIKAIGTLKQQILKGAKMSVVGYVGFFKAYDKTFDMCDLGSKFGINCPVQPGKQTIGGSIALPSNVPSGITVKLTIIAKDHTNAEVLCLKGDLKIVSKVKFDEID